MSFDATDGKTRDGVAQTALTLEDNRLAGLVFGQYDQNLAHLERRLQVQATVNGNHIVLKGPKDATEQAARVLKSLYQQVKSGKTLTKGDLDGAIAESVLQGSLFPGADGAKSGFGQIVTRKRGPVKARNAAQDAYLRALQRHELVFAEGPAGTGKTWLAVGHAVQLLEQGKVERLILSRPAVEAGERLGFLPGTLNEKIDPYLRPLYDALHDMLDPESVPKLLTAGTIEVAPLAYMRGRSLNDAFIILDEAQNTSMEQMKMFLTRLGFGSKIVVTGDITQVDLPGGTRSGLRVVQGILDNVDDIAFCHLTNHDVVRHKLVGRIVAAYDRFEATDAPVPPRTR